VVIHLAPIWDFCMSVAIATSTIAQQAFRFMGIGTLSSLGDTDPRVVAAAEQYTPSLKMTLEQVDWSFASTVASIPENSASSAIVADPRYAHTFALPEDLLILREVLVDNVSYRADQDLLRCTAPGPLKIRYTRLIDKEDRLPATFQTAVSAQLALLMAPEYVKTERAIGRINDALSTAIDRAARNDAVTASPKSYQQTSSGGDWVSEACR